MSFRSILVAIDFDDAAASPVASAAAVADRFKSSLTGFAACALQPIAVPDAGIVEGEFLELQREDIEKRLTSLAKDLRLRAGSGRTVEWRGYVDWPTRRLLEEARSADLVVLAPGIGAGLNQYRTIDRGELIVSLGRPVLAIPEGSPVPGERVLIAWKDARESRRAVRDALPFLGGAKEVSVVTVADPADAAARASAGDVAAYLARHGIQAKAELVAGGSVGDGERIVEIAKARKVDLIVSGAYGHSRLREWVFGGVTRSLLGEAPCARLLSN